MANSLAWIGASYYQASGVVFNNSPYLSRGAQFTGISNSAVGILSFWLKCSGNDGVLEFIIRQAAGISFIQKNAGNSLAMDFQLTAGADLTVGAGIFTASSNWHHLGFYWDTSDNAKCGVMVDGVRSAPITNSNNPVLYNQTDWGVAANHVGGSPFFGSLADMYFNSAETLDLNVPANLAKFYSGGRPVYLGATGTLPTGNQPIMFLTGNAAAFPTNQGSGGGMTLHGVITDDPSGP